MAIKKIRITNFKSFKESEVELGRFNVLIGPNACGKSNFVQIFKFLKDIVESGLNNAVSMQGGVEYLRNINIGLDEDFSVAILTDQMGGFGRHTTKGIIGMKTHKTNYEFVMKFSQKGLGFKIVKEKLIQEPRFIRLEERKGKLEETEKLGTGKLIVSRTDRKVGIDLDTPGEIPITEDDIFPSLLRREELPPSKLLLEDPFFHVPSLETAFGDISIYDFDPRLPKKATAITGKAELEEDATNLSIVLKNIIESKERKRKLFNLVRDLLPFINDLDVEKFADKSLLFKLREIYSGKQYLPASLISHGTINVTALIVALYFETKVLTIIEEPGRNMHPYLVSRIIDMMKDVSRKKQIIVTTHNPEVVKYAGLENILLVSRDEEGFSTISRPGDKEEVKAFLENEIGIEELYVQNLLGV